jgi:eukaryotic-like serine/threonine-protein kinase
MGTPAYCSPEQIDGKTLDNRADIYSLGIMMFQMLTGELPLKPKMSSFDGWAQCHHFQKPKAFNAVKSKLNLPQELMDIVNQCMAKTAEKRPESVTEILKILERVERELIKPIPLTLQTNTSTSKSNPPLSAEDICYQSTWPQDKPRAEIVFPQLIHHEGKELATLWIMLSHEEIKKYQQNKPHSQFLFIASPHPMLLWLTTLYQSEQSHRMLPCYLDLKKPISEKILQMLIQSSTYRLVLFALDGDERCVSVVTGNIPRQKNQRLKEWSLESQNSPSVPGQIRESKRWLKEELDALKPKLIDSLKRQIAKK